MATTTTSSSTTTSTSTTTTTTIVLQSQTIFSIVGAPEAFEEAEDLYLFPENEGIDAVRELHYPADKYAPILYEQNPEKWLNFDSAPMTNLPQVKAEMTLSSVQVVQWKGYMPDRSVKEFWSGSENVSRMMAYFFRRLYEYFIDPPADDYIIWYPKDRTEQGYKIQIEALTVAGADIQFMDIAIRNSMIPWEVIFQFRIIGEAD